MLSGLEAAQKINDWGQIGYSYNNIVTIYRLMGNYTLALEIIRHSNNLYFKNLYLLLFTKFGVKITVEGI